MESQVNRRTFVAASGVALAIVGSAAALAASPTNPDAELLALSEPWERTLKGLTIYGPLHSRAEDALSEAKRTQPFRPDKELERETGFDIAETRWEAAVDANTDVLDLIAATPARTLEGLRFKAYVCAKSDFESDLALAIVDDLVAMGGFNA